MTHVHFIGIGGSGLSAIARLLLESGYTVSGSDRTLTPFADEVRKAGAKVYVGHHPRNIADADSVVMSSAISADNPEVEAAKRAGIPVYKRADFLGQLMENKTGIAIAGTHGKTTTTAMTAWVLHELGRDPSFIVGGVINDLGVNAHAGKSNLFVIEADEYDHMFLGLKPRIEVVTSLEHDHPDLFPTLESMYAAFEKFMDLLPEDGTLIVCSDNSGTVPLMSHARKLGRSIVAYGMEGERTINSPLWVIGRDVKPNARGGFDFEVHSNLNSGISDPVHVSLQVPGEHNVQNALAVLAIIDLLGLSRNDAAQILANLQGQAVASSCAARLTVFVSSMIMPIILLRSKLLSQARAPVIPNNVSGLCGNHIPIHAHKPSFLNLRAHSRMRMRSSSPKSMRRVNPRRISPPLRSSAPCRTSRRVIAKLCPKQRVIYWSISNPAMSFSCCPPETPTRSVPM